MWLVGVVSRRWVWLVGVGGIYGCGYQEVSVAVRRYINFLIFPTPLVYVLFAASSLLFVHFLMFFVLVPVHFCYLFNNFFAQYKQT